MKKLKMSIILIGATLLMCSILQKANAQEVLAKVDKVNGTEIYILNEPVRSYEVTGEIKTGPKWVSLFTRGILTENTSNKAVQFINRAKRKAEKNKIDFDALMYDEGKKIKAIKFTDTATEATERVAKVKNIDNVASFIMAEPMEDYRVIDKVGRGVNVIPFLTYGFFNDSIERDVARLAKRTNKRSDSKMLLYSTGRKGSIITFD